MSKQSWKNMNTDEMIAFIKPHFPDDWHLTKRVDDDGEYIVISDGKHTDGIYHIDMFRCMPTKKDLIGFCGECEVEVSYDMHFMGKGRAVKINGVTRIHVNA